MSGRRVAGRVLAGAGLALTAQAALGSRPPGGRDRWTRTNHRGHEVSLLSGPALAVAASATATLPPAAAFVGGLGAALVGGYDDAVGSRPEQRAAKGFRGHLGALRRGEVTTGAAKVVGIGGSGLLAAALLPGTARTPGALLTGGAVVAGSANLLNLLDLRPGRALKVGLLGAVALGQPGPAGAVAALLPADLGERTMQGDAGANALGAVLGLALLQRLPATRDRLTALALLAGLTGASEVVSYSRVIDATPVLHRLDRLGRQP